MTSTTLVDPEISTDKHDTVGQISYHSTTTNHTEKLPVSINLMVAKGCDSLLLKLIAELHHKGVLSTSAVGASVVDGGEILQKR